MKRPRMSPRLRRANMRRAAPALPNGFTIGNLFFGIFAIVDASRGEFSRAVLWIVFGAICDGFDGRVARATGTGSRFGEELDSLVDAISFGLAPGMIIYFSVLQRQGGALWLLVFLFAACAVIRLARFNVTQAGTKKTHFVGLPSPAAGGTLATYFWFSQTKLYNEQLFGMPWDEMVKFVMGGLAILMITQVPYPAMPKVGIRSWKAVGGLLLVLCVIAGITFFGREFFFPFGMLYVLYGLGRALILGFVDRIPTGYPGVDATDEATGELGMASGEDRAARLRRRRQRANMPTPGISPAVQHDEEE
jgi:CDP-diacylglycerol---serine O-phosphatidyltransferase